MLKELDRKVLASCVGRHVDLSTLLAQIAQASGDSDPGASRAKTLAVVGQLLGDGLIRAGKPTPDGKAFVASSLAAKEAIEWIKKEWDALGRPPRPGDITWFAATKEGVRVAGA